MCVRFVPFIFEMKMKTSLWSDMLCIKTNVTDSLIVKWKQKSKPNQKHWLPTCSQLFCTVTVGAIGNSNNGEPRSVAWNLMFSTPNASCRCNTRKTPLLLITVIPLIRLLYANYSNEVFHFPNTHTHTNSHRKREHRHQAMRCNCCATSTKSNWIACTWWESTTWLLLCSCRHQPI